MITSFKSLIRCLRLSTALLAVVFMCSTAQAQFWKEQTQSLLPEQDAFIETAYVKDDQLIVSWQVAGDYYMYRDQFDVVPITPGLTLGQPNYPDGDVEDDPEFGQVVVYFNLAEYSVPITRFPDTQGTLELELKGQGCNKPIGVCYAPQTRKISVNYTSTDSAATDSAAIGTAGHDSDNALSSSTQTGRVAPNNPTSADNTRGKNADKNSFWGYVMAAFGAGILLSFTPCVLPMIPILAGIIAGQKTPSKLRSGWLALCYVFGTLITYAMAGWVAGASGTQLQAHFQNPWVIGAICLLMIILAASLFGAFKIQLPSSLQTKLNGTSINSRSASFSSVGLGLISALVVGACVSPILILTLGAAISQGDPVLGAAIMSAMALGMGSLLVLFGFGAGWLLPRTGAWMNHIQVLFGFMVLGVAIFIASALPAVPTLYLWAALLLWTGSYLLRFAAQLQADLVASLLRGSGFAALLWGSMALIGATTGGSEILNPLSSAQFAQAGNTTPKTKLPFTVVTTAEQAQTLLDQAKAAKQPALVDFYADWCLDCKRMDRTTFLEPSVNASLTGWTLIKVDVTDTNDNSEAVKRHFEVFGPPATLFYASNGQEQQTLRQYGYLKEAELLNLVDRASN